MKKVILTGLVFTCLHGGVLSQTPHDIEKEKAAIKEVIEKFYIPVAVTGNGERELLRKGVHPDFNMYYFNESTNEIDKRDLKKWITHLKAARNRSNPQSAKQPDTYEFAMIDITGTTAIVKLITYRDEKLNFTDYLSLYKFKEGWKIMTKVFTWHNAK